MKKLLIGMLITCSLGLVACGKTNTENSATKNNSGTGVTDNSGTGGTNSTTNNPATGVTDGTNNNSNTPGTAIGTDMEKSKKDVENLYKEFNSKVEAGVDKINADEWEKYKTEFQGEITSIKNNVKDASLTSTLDHMQNLFNEYDRAVREKADVAKDKVEEMKNKIENAFK